MVVLSYYCDVISVIGKLAFFGCFACRFAGRSFFEAAAKDLSHSAKDWKKESCFGWHCRARRRGVAFLCGYFAWVKTAIYGSSFWERAQERADFRLVTLPSSWASKTWASILPIAGPGGMPI